jgi:hypothetical protein
MAAMAADMVRPLQLTAVAAFGMGFRPQRLMAAAHAGARRGGFTFWNGHSCIRLKNWKVIEGAA